MHTCRNCESEIDDSYKFCPHCGQEQLEGDGFRSLFNQFLNDYFTFDSKIWRSVKPLMISPGFLTNEYLRGRRNHYVPPLRLFIFSSIIFFLCLSVFNTSEPISQTVDQETAEWNRYFESWLPKLFFVLLPIFALLLKLFFKRQVKGMLPHFLTAFHFHAAMFIMGIIYTLISALFSGLDLVIVNQVLIVLFLVYLLFYLFQSFRKIYGAKTGRAILKLSGIMLIYLFVLISFSLLLLLLSYNV